MAFSRDDVKLLKDMFGREENAAYNAKNYDLFDSLLALENSVMQLVQENTYGANALKKPKTM